MKIAKSLRFRIIVGYVLFTFIATICYTISGLVVLKISDDELFNWHIAQVAEEKYRAYVDASPPQRERMLANNYLVVGSDSDVMAKIHSRVNSKNEIFQNIGSLENWSEVSHISKGNNGRFEIYEVRFAQSAFHLVKMRLSQSFPSENFFFYIVDISGYDKNDVHAVQGTYFGLFLLLLIFMLVATMVGKLIAKKVISPLTQLTHDVDKANLGSKLSSYYPDEVGGLAVKINDLMTRIGNFIDREKAFSRDVSHELRTPVTSSQVAVELALHLTTSDNPKLREVLGRIADANRDMTHLIETFMLIGRENIPHDAISKTNLFSVVNESIDRNKYLLQGKSVDVVNLADQNINLNQPHKLLIVVIDNILRNAFQYTDQGNITVRANETRISISDTGRGFDQSAVERLLRPYETFHGEGVGLGLNIIKRICELTGWRLEVQSEPGVGSLLIIHF